jgi:hypothetical protein
MSTVPLVPCAVEGDGASTVSSSSSSSTGLLGFRDRLGVGMMPSARQPTTERRNPRISIWLDSIFLSWSVIPFPSRCLLSPFVHVTLISIKHTCMRKVEHDTIKPPPFQSIALFKSGPVYTKQNLCTALPESIHFTSRIRVFIITFLLRIIRSRCDIRW